MKSNLARTVVLRYSRTDRNTRRNCLGVQAAPPPTSEGGIENPAHPSCPIPSRRGSLQRGRPTAVGVEECSQGSARADPWKARPLSPGRAGRQPARMAGRVGSRRHPELVEGRRREFPMGTLLPMGKASTGRSPFGRLSWASDARNNSAARTAVRDRQGTKSHAHTIPQTSTRLSPGGADGAQWFVFTRRSHALAPVSRLEPHIFHSNEGHPPV